MPDIELYLTSFNDWSDTSSNKHLFDVRLVWGNMNRRLSIGASFLGIGVEIGLEIIP